jgi:hypothetical protein
VISAGESAAGEQWQPLLDLDGVGDAVLSAREVVDRLLSHRVLRHKAGALAAEVSLRCARASATLDGADDGLPVEPSVDSPSAGPVLAGALRAQRELPGLPAVWRTSPRQALARLHLLSAAGLAPEDELGRPAGTPGAQLVNRVTGLVRAPSGVPAVVVAAVVQAELSPAFAVAGGVVARAASRLALAERGLDPSLLVATDVGLLEEGDHAGALAAYGTGEPAGVARWLLHIAAAVESGARESLAICEALTRG